MTTRSYTELSRLHTFEDRFDYLSLRGRVGEATFGYDRYINQEFYRSTQWRQTRDRVIARDEGCDMGVGGYEIYDKILIHHMNPMQMNDIVNASSAILDPEFLIAVTHRTHQAIHYGDRSMIRQPLVARKPGDTKLWA
jgi:hypothetical protein